MRSVDAFCSGDGFVSDELADCDLRSVGREFDEGCFGVGEADGDDVVAGVGGFGSAGAWVHGDDCSRDVGIRKVLTPGDLCVYDKYMTTTWNLTRKSGSTDWIKAISRDSLEVIYSRSTDEYTRRECMAEMDRRDDEEAIAAARANLVDGHDLGYETALANYRLAKAGR